MVDHASGIFSVVQKADDIAADTLTVRARVRGDLDALREHYLPSLGEVQESKTNDYRLRAVAPRAGRGCGDGQHGEPVEVQQLQEPGRHGSGTARAHLYHDVWDVLHRLQTEPAKYQAAPKTHPSQRASLSSEVGRTRQACRAQKPSEPVLWPLGLDAKAIACVIPEGPMPK